MPKSEGAECKEPKPDFSWKAGRISSREIAERVHGRPKNLLEKVASGICSASHSTLKICSSEGTWRMRRSSDPVCSKVQVPPLPRQLFSPYYHCKTERLVYTGGWLLNINSTKKI